MSIMPVQGVGAQPISPQTSHSQPIPEHILSTIHENMQAVKDIMQAAVNSSKTFDTETKFLTKSQLGVQDKNESTLRQTIGKEGKLAHQIPPEMLEEILEYFSSDEINKKRKKDRKSKLEEKLKAILEKLEDVDLSQLPPEEKAVFEEFMENMSRITQMRGRLKQLDLEQIKYEQLLKAKEEKQQR